MVLAKHLELTLALAVGTLLAPLPGHHSTRAWQFSSPVWGHQAERNTTEGAAQQNPGPPQPGQDQPADSPDESEQVTMLAGAVISVRIADKVDSNHDHTGDLLTGIVDPSVLMDNRVVIPRGTEAHIRMTEDKKGGHLHGKAEVELQLVSLVMNGHQLEVESGAYTKGKGAISAKAKSAAADVSFCAGGALTGTAIAVFRAPKVALDAGKRISFTLTDAFTFAKPPTASATTNK